VAEDSFLAAHLLEFARVVINRCRAGNVCDDFELFIQNGDEAAAVAVFWPVIGEVSYVVIIFVEADLAGISSWKIDLVKFFSIEVQAQEVLLIAHGDEDVRLGRCCGIDHAAVGAPVGDAAFWTTHDFLKFPSSVVAKDVIFAVAIEHKEISIWQMQGPRRFVFVGFSVFLGGFRPMPFLQDLAVECGFGDQVLL